MIGVRDTMSAFGKRQPGMAGAGSRPAFRCCKSNEGPGQRSSTPVAKPGQRAGDQFPPLPRNFPRPTSRRPRRPMARYAAWGRCDRLADQRQASSSGESGQQEGRGIRKLRSTGSRNRCCRACSSGSTPKPRRRSARTSWPRNSGRLSAKCSTELKINAQPPRAVRARKGTGRRIAWARDRSRNCSTIPNDQRHHGQRSGSVLSSNARASSSWRRSSSATRNICSRSPSGSVNSVGRRVDQTTPLADARLKDGSAASTSSSRRSACAAPRSRFVNSPPSRSRST